MIHHYITKYRENGKRWAEAWMQINIPIIGWCICFWSRKIEL